MELEVKGKLTHAPKKRGVFTLQDFQDFVDESQVAGVPMSQVVTTTLGYRDSTYSYRDDCVRSLSVPVRASADLYGGPVETKKTRLPDIDLRYVFYVIAMSTIVTVFFLALIFSG